MEMKGLSLTPTSPSYISIANPLLPPAGAVGSDKVRLRIEMFVRSTSVWLFSENLLGCMLFLQVHLGLFSPNMSFNGFK